MKRCVYFSIMDSPYSGHIWCDGKCDECPFKFACWTISYFDRLGVKLTEAQYDKWIAPHFHKAENYE